MFSHVFVCPRGCIGGVLGLHPREGVHPRERCIWVADGCTPSPPQEVCTRRQTVNRRVVRILLECILVYYVTSEEALHIRLTLTFNIFLGKGRHHTKGIHALRQIHLVSICLFYFNGYVDKFLHRQYIFLFV